MNMFAKLKHWYLIIILSVMVLMYLNLNRRIDDFEDKLKDVKKPLIKNISDPEVYKNLIVFRIYHSNQFPFKETILPLAKRKVMNYMIQSKYISKKNLTNKTL